MNNIIKTVLTFLIAAGCSSVALAEDRAQASFDRVTKEKLSELLPQAITNKVYEEFISSIWCTTQSHGEKTVWYTFWGFNTQSGTISNYNLEMPTFVRPNLKQFQLEWDRDDHGNLKSGSWMSGLTFVRQNDRIDILVGSKTNADIVHVVKTKKVSV